jgi:hypothetical protein
LDTPEPAWQIALVTPVLHWNAMLLSFGKRAKNQAKRAFASVPCHFSSHPKHLIFMTDHFPAASRSSNPLNATRCRVVLDALKTAIDELGASDLSRDLVVNRLVTRLLRLQLAMWKLLKKAEEREQGSGS